MTQTSRVHRPYSTRGRLSTLIDAARAAGLEVTEIGYGEKGPWIKTVAAGAATPNDSALDPAGEWLRENGAG